MAGLPGPAPKAQKVGHTPPAHEYIDVPNVPFRGRKPALPKELPTATKTWWRVVTSMPHCALWSPDDWQFALDTARVHGRFVDGARGDHAAELRRRGDLLGLTWHARRQLRIRYVDSAEELSDSATAGSMSDFAAERQKRLLSAG